MPPNKVVEKLELAVVDNLKGSEGIESSVCGGPAIMIVDNVVGSTGCTPSAPPSR